MLSKSLIRWFFISFQEFELLHYSLSSARIFFRPQIQQDEAEDEEQKQEK